MSAIRFTTDADYLDPQTRSAWEAILTAAWCRPAPKAALDRRTQLILARHRAHKRGA